MPRTPAEQLAHLERLGERYELEWALPPNWQKSVTRAANCAYERNESRMKMGFATLDEVVDNMVKNGEDDE